MTRPAAFGYCQARLQSHYAALPDAADWRSLAGARTLAAALEEARAGRLRPWVQGLGGQTDGAEVERRLRLLAGDLAERTATWVPRDWRAAVAWCAWVPYLPLIARLAEPGPGPGAPGGPAAWAAADPRLCPLIDAAGRPDPAALMRTGLLATNGIGRPPAIAAAWTDGWRARWPPCRGAGRRDLEALAERLAAHLRAFRTAAPETAWDRRGDLRERLRREFHRHLLAPAGVFIYLALLFLDLERLRAELLRRALFPSLPPC